MIEILIDKCSGCGKCTKHCPLGIIYISNKKANIEKIHRCINCGHCQGVCEFNAISLNGMLPQDTVAKQNVSFIDLKNLIISNRSIRKFKNKIIEKNKLEEILNILEYTASAQNEQPVKWIVVSGKKEVNKIFQMTIKYLEKNNLEIKLLKFIKTVKNNPITINAPYLLFAYADENAVKPNDDCFIKMASASLLMHSCGIGSCYLGYLEDLSNQCLEIKNHLKLEKPQKVFSVIGFGYSDEVYTKIPARKKADVRYIENHTILINQVN